MRSESTAVTWQDVGVIVITVMKLAVLVIMIMIMSARGGGARGMEDVGGWHLRDQTI